MTRLKTRAVAAGGLLAACVLLVGCAGAAGSITAGELFSQSADVTAVESPAASQDPNAAGRASAAATAQPRASTADVPAMPGGSTAICANETLGESMARTVQAGSSVVLATGGFTGNTMLADGEIGVVYSEVQLTVERALAGPPVPDQVSAWVYGDLGAPADAAVSTGEASSLWAAGGRMIAIVDGQVELAGLPGPVIRVAPVVGDEVILSWVGCWPTNGIATHAFDGGVDIFDERGLRASDLELQAAALADFEAVLTG